jgi:hypothetical protein
MIEPHKDHLPPPRPLPLIYVKASTAAYREVFTAARIRRP